MRPRTTDVSTWAPLRDQLLEKARSRLTALERQIDEGRFVQVAKLESARKLVAFLEGKRV